MAICAAVCVVAASSDYLVKDPSDDELDDGETVESTGEGVVAGGPMSPPSCAAVKKGRRGACQQKAATVLPNRTAAA